MLALNQIPHRAHLFETIHPTLQNILGSKDRSGNGRVCLGIEVVHRQTIMYYQPSDNRAFLKVTMALPGLVAPTRSAWDE